ncbi:transporter substrate-binding domain-containing protein [Shewanella sp. AS1]|nr:transporter substrate-binding domain-containing protein [Shewanella sp. AS1]
MFGQLICSLFCVIPFAIPSLAKAETLHLTSLNWPPYTGEKLQQGGVTVVIITAAMNAVGHQVKVDYYPWSRVLRLVKRDDSIYRGYFPEYLYPTEDYVFSDPVGHSPLGLIEQADFPLKWQQVRDLNRYQLGVVQDYVNTYELDGMIANGSQKVELANSDEHNIQKVATGRVQGAVIDRHVFNYLVDQTHLKPLKNKLQFNKQLLELRSLHIAFKNNPEGIKWRDTLNRGLKQIDQDKIIQAYWTALALDD